MRWRQPPWRACCCRPPVAPALKGLAPSQRKEGASEIAKTSRAMLAWGGAQGRGAHEAQWVATRLAGAAPPISTPTPALMTKWTGGDA